MKVLIASSFELDSPAIGAQRTRALWEHLNSRGHEATLLGARPDGRPGLFDGGGFERLTEDSPGHAGKLATGKLTAPGRKPSSHVRRLGGVAKRALFDWPDSKRARSWHDHAVECFAEAWASKEYEVVVSSGPPWVCHKLGRHVASTQGIPWFADYRDLWTNGTYYPHPSWRRRIEVCIERHWLGDATAITAVTPGLTDALRNLSPRVPCHTIWNGFGGEELSSVEDRDLGSGINMVYAGSWYTGKRDPRALLDALVMDSRLQECRLHLVGNVSPEVLQEIAKRNLGERIVLDGSVGRSDALSIVKSADIALVFGWNDPKDKDVVGAKVFELIGMKKAIIAMAYPHGVLAEVVRRYGFGHVANGAAEIRAAVHDLQKRVEGGEVPNEDVVRSFDRRIQLERWEGLLNTVGGVW